MVCTNDKKVEQKCGFNSIQSNSIHPPATWILAKSMVNGGALSEHMQWQRASARARASTGANTGLSFTSSSSFAIIDQYWGFDLKSNNWASSSRPKFWLSRTTSLGLKSHDESEFPRDWKDSKNWDLARSIKPIHFKLRIQPDVNSEECGYDVTKWVNSEQFPPSDFQRSDALGQKRAHPPMIPPSVTAWKKGWQLKLGLKNFNFNLFVCFN